MTADTGRTILRASPSRSRAAGKMIRQGSSVRWVRVAMLCAAGIVLAFAAASGMPVLAQNDDPGDCAACHGEEQVLSPGHVPTVGMKTEACVTCHQPGTPLALLSAIPLDHRHMLGGVTCRGCHGDTEPPGFLTTSQCLACHGPLEELAGRTADTRPSNPHSTPHGPTFAECDLCHHAHAEPENFCAQCHDFHYVVP